MINCVSCGKELAGEIDTFGAHGEPQCQACYLSGALTPAQQAERDEDIREQAEIQALKGELEDIGYSLRDVYSEIAQLEPQLKALRATLKQLKKREAEVAGKLEGYGVGA